MASCSYCGSGNTCDCYYDVCPICEKVISIGRPCKSCKYALLRKQTITKRCRKCQREKIFVVCVKCNEEPAFFCTECYDNNKMSKGKFYTHCGPCS